MSYNEYSIAEDAYASNNYYDDDYDATNDTENESFHGMDSGFSVYTYYRYLTPCDYPAGAMPGMHKFFIVR